MDVYGVELGRSRGLVPADSPCLSNHRMACRRSAQGSRTASPAQALQVAGGIGRRRRHLAFESRGSASAWSILGGEADGIDQYADGDPDDDVMEAYDGLYPDEVVDLEDDHLEYDIDPEYHTPPPEPNEEGEREHDDDPLEEMDVYDVALEEPGVIAVPLPTPMEAASAGEVEKLSGYVYCALEPWKSLPYLGRVTEWPDTAPREKRVCLLRCGLHDSCSVKIGRRHVSDDDLLEWLFSGEIPPEGADRFTRITLGGAHREMWKHRT